MSMRTSAPVRHRSGTSGLLPMLCIAIAGVTASTQLLGADQVDRVFADGFETKLVGYDDIRLYAIVTSDPACPDTGHDTLDTRPGAPVRFCYRLENHSNVTLERQEITSSTFGVIFQGALQIPPGQSVVIADPTSPHAFVHRAIDLVNWHTSGAGRTGAGHRTAYVNIAPDIALYRFLTADAARCQPGITPYTPTPTNSGYTALTVAPGTLLTHCFRAKNTSIGGFSTLTDSLVVDSLFGTLPGTGQSFSNGEVYTIAAQQPATTSIEADAQWSTSDGVDPASATAHSSLTVTTHPACDGIREGTSYDYVFDFYGFQALAKIRLDFEVTATPASAGASMTVDAHGAITSLFPDNAFGPRRDTRVYLPIPAGIDLARPFQAQASINAGVPISATLDTAGRMLLLSTGAVGGAPAEINVHITGYIDALQTQPIAWTAPKLQMDIEGDNETVATTEILPDPAGPPVLTTPLCSTP